MKNFITGGFGQFLLLSVRQGDSYLTRIASSHVNTSSQINSCLQIMPIAQSTVSLLADVWVAMSSANYQVTSIIKQLLSPIDNYYQVTTVTKWQLSLSDNSLLYINCCCGSTGYMIHIHMHPIAVCYYTERLEALCYCISVWSSNAYQID